MYVNGLQQPYGSRHGLEAVLFFINESTDIQNHSKETLFGGVFWRTLYVKILLKL